MPYFVVARWVPPLSFPRFGPRHTFDQLLGIKNEGDRRVLRQWQRGHPNRGYLLTPPFAQGNFGNEDFPGSKPLNGFCFLPFPVG